MENVIANAQSPCEHDRATKVLSDAFRIYYRDKKESTKDSKEDELNRILQFYRHSGDIVSRIDQRGYNDLKEYLIRKHFQRGTINQTLSLFSMLVNKVMYCHNGFSKYNFRTIVNCPIERIRIKSEDNKKRPLEKEEIEKLFGVKGLSETQQKYLDVFKVQLLTGQRFSDLPKIFEGRYIVEVIDNIETWKLKTQKEGVTSIIVPNTELKEIVKKYNGVFPVSRNSSASNYQLKKIAKKVGLDNIEKYLIQVGGILFEKTARTYEIISSHWFRYTFICDKKFEGYDDEVISKMSGHSNCNMIREIYGKIAIEKTKAKDVIRNINNNRYSLSSVNNDILQLLLQKERDIFSYEIKVKMLQKIVQDVEEHFKLV